VCSFSPDSCTPARNGLVLQLRRFEFRRHLKRSCLIIGEGYPTEINAERQIQRTCPLRAGMPDHERGRIRKVNCSLGEEIAALYFQQRLQNQTTICNLVAKSWPLDSQYLSEGRTDLIRNFEHCTSLSRQLYFMTFTPTKPNKCHLEPQPQFRSPRQSFYSSSYSLLSSQVYSIYSGQFHSTSSIQQPTFHIQLTHHFPHQQATPPLLAQCPGSRNPLLCPRRVEEVILLRIRLLRNCRSSRTIKWDC